MVSRQIMCCVRYVSSILGVFRSDLLHRHSIALSGTPIVNTDPHTESSSHCLAIHFQSQSHSSYYFDSYGLPQYIPSIHSFIRRNCFVFDYKLLQLQGPTLTVSDEYCSLLSLYMDRGYTPEQFFGLSGTDIRQVGYRNVPVGICASTRYASRRAVQRQ